MNDEGRKLCSRSRQVLRSGCFANGLARGEKNTVSICFETLPNNYFKFMTPLTAETILRNRWTNEGDTGLEALASALSEAERHKAGRGPVS